MTPNEKKQQLANELNRLADVIDALVAENRRLHWIVDTLVTEVEADERIKCCWIDYDKPSVHIEWKQADR